MSSPYPAGTRAVRQLLPAIHQLPEGQDAHRPGDRRARQQARGPGRQQQQPQQQRWRRGRGIGRRGRGRRRRRRRRRGQEPPQPGHHGAQQHRQFLHAGPGKSDCTTQGNFWASGVTIARTQGATDKDKTLGAGQALALLTSSCLSTVLFPQGVLVHYLKQPRVSHISQRPTVLRTGILGYLQKSRGILV